MLQKMAEIMEYHELLDKAAKCEVRLCGIELHSQPCHSNSNAIRTRSCASYTSPASPWALTRARSGRTSRSTQSWVRHLS